MKVFISWSGELSKQLAEALRKWLPSTLQYVKPYYTPADIEKGAKWNDEISKELNEASVCIIALTRESLDSKWIMFEAGAISRGNAPVCAILFDIEPTDIQGPLEAFQATKFSKKEINQLLTTVNSKAGDRALDQSVLENVFEKWWPELEEKIGQIIKEAKSVQQSQQVRDDRSLLEELVTLARAIAAEQREIIHRLVALGAAGTSENTIRMAKALAAGSAPLWDNANLRGAAQPPLGPTGYAAPLDWALGYGSAGSNITTGSARTAPSSGPHVQRFETVSDAYKGPPEVAGDLPRKKERKNRK